MVTEPLAVVVSGALGAGKTTLALQLLSPLGATLLSKDRLKEAMHEPMVLDTDERSMQASVAAMRLIYSIAEASRSPLVLDANWKPMDIPQLVTLGRPLVQVFCTAPGRVLKERVLSRVRSGERHPVHRDGMLPELLERIARNVEAGTAAPLDMSCPLIEVDTTQQVDVDALVVRINEACAIGDRVRIVNRRGRDLGS